MLPVILFEIDPRVQRAAGGEEPPAPTTELPERRMGSFLVRHALGFELTVQGIFDHQLAGVRYDRFHMRLHHSESAELA
jgi:hypothetical protein